MNGGIRYLEETAFHERHRLRPEVQPHPKTKAQTDLACRRRRAADTEQADVLIRYARQANGCRRVRRDAFWADGIVVGLEADECQLPHAVVAREITIARDADAELAIVASQERDTPTERCVGMAASGAVFDRDRRNGGTDTRTPLRRNLPEGGARERDD